MVELVDRFSSGYMTTDITCHSRNFVWRHVAGPDRPQPLTGPSASFRILAQGALHHDMAFVTPKMGFVNGKAALTYNVAGPTSLAAMIFSGQIPDNVEELIYGVGRMLDRFHDQLPEHNGKSPSGLERLRAWMDSGSGTRAASQWHAMASIALQPDRWRRLRTWCEEFTDGRYIVHGAYGMGMVVPSTKNILHTSVLAGSEDSVSLREFDLGWFIGELCETAVFITGGVERLVRLRDSFFEGYQRAYSAEKLRRAATLRVAIHAHDFSAFMGWSRDFPTYVKVLKFMLDRDGDVDLTELPSLR